MNTLTMMSIAAELASFYCGGVRRKAQWRKELIVHDDAKTKLTIACRKTDDDNMFSF